MVPQKKITIPPFLAPSHILPAAAALLIFAVLYLLSVNDYLLFHSIVELVTIAIAFAIFVIVWNTRRNLSETFFLIIGISFLFTGSIDLLHTLAFKGMGVFPGNNADLPTQLWIAARYFQSIAFFIAALLIGRSITKDRKYDVEVITGACAAVFLLLLASIFVWQNFPHCYIEGSGLTPFKIASEYIISAILILTAILLYLRRRFFDDEVWRFLILGQLFLVLGELAFTSYVSVYGFMNMLGHLFKLLSFYLFYRAIVVVALTRPTDLLFHRLKEDEKVLRESEEKYRAFFTTSMDAVFITSGDGRWLDFNDAAVGFFGYGSREELQEVRIQDLYADPADRKKHIRYISEKGHSLEYPVNLRKKDGTIINTLITSVAQRDAIGSVVRFQGTIRNVTSQNRAEEALRESEEKYRGVAERSSDLIMLTDSTGRIQYIAPSVKRILGFGPEELVGSVPGDLAHPDDLDTILRLGEGRPEEQKTAVPFEARIRQKDGRYATLEFTGTPIMREGVFAGMQVIGRDISARKIVEEEERLARERFETLVKVSEMRDATETELSEYVMEAACRITGSTLAFIGTMNADESVMDITTWSVSAMQDCRVAASPIHFPIEKAGIWADAVRTRTPKIVNDYSAPHKGKKGLPAGHVAITRFLSLPVLDQGKVSMVAAVANKPSGYDDADVTRLTLLMQGVWANLKNRRVGEALKKSETLLNDMGEMAKVGGWEIDVRTQEVRMTQEAYRIHEIPVGEVYTLSRAARFFDEPGWSSLQAALQHCIETGEPFDLELPFTTATGRHLWTRAIGRAVTDNGKIVKVAGTFQDITELRMAREDLRESRQILEGVLNTITVRVFWKDKNLIYLGCNTPFARDAGFDKPEDLIGKDDTAMSWREQAELYRADDRTVIETGKGKLLFEEPSTTPTGEKIHLLTSKVPLRDAKGDIIGVLGTYLDITAYRLAEEALRESEIRFRELFNSMSSGVAVYRAVDDGADFEFVDFNHGAEIIEKVGKEDVIGRRVSEAFPGVSEFGLMEVFRRVWQSGISEHHPISLYQDKRIASWRENYVYRLPTGEIVAIYDDVTLRRQADEALRESEQKFRDIFNNTTDAIHIHEIQKDGVPGRFTDVNAVACRMLGYTREELLAMTPLEIATDHHDPPLETIFENQRTLGVARFETEHRRKDGTIIPVEVNTHVVTIQGRNVMLGVVRDMTEHKKAEALLRNFNEELELQVRAQTEKINASLQEKILLLREIHHRVKNNLQIIISLVNLQMRKIEDDRLRQVMQETQNRVRAMSLVHEKLYQSADIGRINLADYTRFLATHLFTFYGVHSHKVRLQIDIGEIMLDVNTAIPAGLIINELVSNTLKHAFPDNRSGLLAIAAYEEGNTIHLTIRDTGVGMEPGFDWKESPSLGFRLVTSLVDQLNGTIEKLPGPEGTGFAITIRRTG